MSSYALDSKKRKFDRILESLTDRPTSQPTRPTTAKTDNSNGATTLRQELIAAAKRRRVSGKSQRSVSQGSLLTHYLPSSRAAFLERLETYRHITKWHIPSTIAINASAWARRGWICADIDTVSCPSCHERVKIDLSVQPKTIEGDDEEENEEMSAELYKALVARYSSMVVTAHADGCSWRKRGCDDSIQRIEGLLNTNDAIQSLTKRCTQISAQVKDIPEVQDLPLEQGLQTVTAQDLVDVEADFSNPDIVKLAVCGWQYKDGDVLECRHCFRSLGLWLYRGTAPTIENLDAVDSHLEYCPWRSPEAQATELIVGSEPKRFAGWALVAAAVEKHVKRKREVPNGIPKKNTAASDGQGEVLTPEEREKKRRDLMRRVKELKKPFNVSNLIGRIGRTNKS